LGARKSPQICAKRWSGLLDLLASDRYRSTANSIKSFKVSGSHVYLSRKKCAVSTPLKASAQQRRERGNLHCLP
jgi:hypothetical protein